jgi:regulator of protease activity HflC (stomatin/prohibitin superfamily)
MWNYKPQTTNHKPQTYMALIIIGVIVILLGLAVTRSNDANFRRFSSPIRIIGAIFILIGILTSSIIQIDAGEIGIKKLFGKVQNDVLPSGLHFINPLLDVERMDVRTQNYTMSGVRDEGAKSGDDAIRALTSDGLEDYDAVSLYSVKRDEFQGRIFKSIEADFKRRGLMLEQLLVRNITLPTMVKTAIEQKITAEQDAQKMQFVLQKERQEAERKRVEAQGIADYQRIINESLTDRQLQYEQIKAMKELANSSNAKMVIMGKGNTPLILDGKQ